MSRIRRRVLQLLIYISVVSVVGCNISTLPMDVGQKIYIHNCAMCHQSTLIGPKLEVPSLELLKLKVREGKYPVGYFPKRNTNVMPKFNLSDKDLEAIQEYLKVINTF